jgi:hypothetical protein
MRRSSPDPRVVKELALSVVTQVGLVVGHYRWLHSAANDRTVGDDVRGDRAKKHAADPTGGLIASEHKGSARDTLYQAHEDLASVLADLKAIEAHLLKALDGFDPRPTPSPLAYPRTALRSDVEAAKQAQSRRKTRGDDIPA